MSLHTTTDANDRTAATTTGTPSLFRRLLQVTASGTTFVLAGSAFAAVGAYVFQLLGARMLGPAAFAPLSVLWTIQVLLLAVALVPLEQFVTRRLELTGGHSAELGSAARAVVSLLGLCLVGVLVFVTLTLDTFFAGDAVYIALAGLLTAAYALFVLARGYLAGRRRYRAYGVATAGESMFRLVVAVIAVMIAADAVSLGVAMIAAPLATLALKPFYRSTEPAVPYTETATTSSASSKAGFFLGSLVVANAASQALLGSAPLIAGAFGAQDATVSVVFVTFALFRGPIWIVQGAAARMLPPLTALARRDDIPALTRWVRRIAAAGLVVTALGFVGGLLMGPAVVRLLFGAAFDPPRMLTALAACASALAAVALVSGQILIATGRTGRLAMSWLTALPVAGLVAWATPAAPDIRVGVALVAGEATAVILAVIGALLLSSQAKGNGTPAGDAHDARAPGGE